MAKGDILPVPAYQGDCQLAITMLLYALHQGVCSVVLCVACMMCCMSHMWVIVTIVVVFQKAPLSPHYSNMRMWF